MADNDSAATYPNDYDTGTYTSMTTYVSISGRYTGAVTTANPYTGSSSNKYYYEAWTFTTTAATHIDVTLTGNGSAGNSVVSIFNSTNFTGTAVASNTASSGNPAILSQDLTTAGTYYIIVESSSKNATTTSYALTSSLELTKILPAALQAILTMVKGCFLRD